MEAWLDHSSAPRAGEELDLERLAAYLDRQLPEIQGALEVEQFPSGFSNLTYLLRRGEHELVLRRPPFGNQVKTAHDMSREHRVLSALHGAYPTPRPYLYCDEDSVLGAPFYIMERVRGIILRKTLPEGLQLSPVLAGRLSRSLITQLAALHQLDADALGLSDLGRPEGYVERQVKGWTKRYHRAQTDTWKELDQVIAWLHDDMPDDHSGSLVHNDYKYDNLVLDPDDLTRVVAVLDWEMCTVGDPWLDLGTTLAYWTEEGDDPQFKALAFGPTAIPGSLTRQQLVEEYQHLTGRKVTNLTFYYAFGLFKLAVIVQQIYYRFFHGHTQDPRFAQLNHMVGLLGKAGLQAIESDRI